MNVTFIASDCLPRVPACYVADLGAVLDRASAALTDGGTIVVAEWAWERFDEATAGWCFARLPGPSAEHDWLRHRHDEWRASGLPWEIYQRDWATAEHLHPAADIVTALDARFDRVFLGYGPCFFASLPGVSEADEQAAIDAGDCQKLHRVADAIHLPRRLPGTPPEPAQDPLAGVQRWPIQLYR